MEQTTPENIDLLLAQQEISGDKPVALDAVIPRLKTGTYFDSLFLNLQHEANFEYFHADDLLKDATTVLMRMPKSLSQLDEYAQLIANYAKPEVKVYAAGKDKHMNKNFNAVLAKYFKNVQASLGWKKCRVISAEGVISKPEITYPAIDTIQELDIKVAAHGGVFAGTKFDIGTRTFLELLNNQNISGRVADLGCGNGLVSAFLLKNYPGIQLEASDDSDFACRSTIKTLQLNGYADFAEHNIRVTQNYSLNGISARYDHVFLNPPFHGGTRVDPQLGVELIQAAYRALKPGGKLWCVYNSGLGIHYMPEFKKFGGKLDYLGNNKNNKFGVISVTKA